MEKTVRVLLAVSSPLTQKALERLLANANDIEIVGIAKRGLEVLPLITTTRPHLLCVVDSSPSINALDLTREIMRTQPSPILVLSDAPNLEQTHTILEAGALDVIPRPNVVAPPDPVTSQQFVSRIKMLARVPVIGRRPSTHSIKSSPSFNSEIATPLTSSPPTYLPQENLSKWIVAVGASTGGPMALMTVLSSLPASYPFPIVCVQHVSKGFLEGMISWLDKMCHLRVSIAEPGTIVRPGTILFPPEDKHLEIGPGGRIRLSNAPARDGHRPSATILFESVAASYGSHATAILLTGMGTDGASGLATVFEAGGDTIAQDEASCVVFGMPRAAIERGAARHVCSPDEITRRLLSLAQGHTPINP